MCLIIPAASSAPLAKDAIVHGTWSEVQEKPQVEFDRGYVTEKLTLAPTGAT